MLDTHGLYVKGKMENISPMILVNIYWTPTKVEIIYNGAYFSLEKVRVTSSYLNNFMMCFFLSYDKILRIDPCIVEHEIRTYQISNPF